jgi:tryptophan synthase alpha chain
MASAHRIKNKFRELRARGEAALIPFIVAGDPDLDTTRRLVLELEARGADLIELGVPFSDPMADGPANQRASARGLGAGASLAAILSMVSELRAQTQIPVILFGYYNPIFHYGCERLCADGATAAAQSRAPPAVSSTMCH